MPLFIVHKDQPAANPFIVAVPRFSYLAQLLPRLSSFFGVPCSSFHHEDIQLRNLTVGLLVDLYQPQLPWRLEVGGGDEWDIGDTFLNGVKEVRQPPPSLCHVRNSPMLEGGQADPLCVAFHHFQADFVRNGNAKQIMSLSKDHTTALWNAVQDSKYILTRASWSTLRPPPPALRPPPSTHSMLLALTLLVSHCATFSHTLDPGLYHFKMRLRFLPRILLD